MLADAVKLRKMPCKAADMRERGRDILDLDIVLLDIEVIKMFAG
jgi:hypothetical protein